MRSWTVADWKDFWQVAAWMIAVAGGFVAAWKAISEMRLTRLQRARDLAWAQAREVFAILDRLSSDPELRAACQMLDYSRGTYAISPTVEAEITTSQVLRALRTSDLSFSDKEHFIRDCFDAYFMFLDRVEMAVEVGIVAPHQVVATLDYYASLMAREPAPFRRFAERYGYERALRLLARLPAWASTLTREDGELHGDKEGVIKESVIAKENLHVKEESQEALD